MCVQKTTYDALKKNGAFAKTPKAEVAMMEAQIADVERLSNGQGQIKEQTSVLAVRMENVEKDIAEIKKNMVSKNDLAEFKNELLPAIQQASKYELVQRAFNWKTILTAIIVIFVAVIIAGFGLRGLEILAPIGNTAAGALS